MHLKLTFKKKFKRKKNTLDFFSKNYKLKSWCWDENYHMLMTADSAMENSVLNSHDIPIDY